MRSSVAKGTAAVLAALGLSLAAPALASAAPAGGGVQLCVDGFADHTAAGGRLAVLTDYPGTEGTNLGV